MDVEKRLEKLAIELKLTSQTKVAEITGIRRQYLSPLFSLVKNGDLLKLIRYFDENSPIDEVKRLIEGNNG